MHDEMKPGDTRKFKHGDGNAVLMQSAATDPNLLLQIGGAAQQTRKPRQQHADRPAVAQLDPTCCPRQKKPALR